jgi:uncharacterized protein (TIGR02145 family)
VPTAEEFFVLNGKFGNGLFYQNHPGEKNSEYPLRCVYTCPRIFLDNADESTQTQVVCQNEPIKIVAHSWSGAAANATLTWDIEPAGITGNASSFSGTPTTAGVFKWTITVEHHDKKCPSLIDTGSITVHALPATVVVSGTTPACDSVVLTASNGNSGTIFWQNTTENDTSTAIASTSQTVRTSGTYYFRARSAEGCWGEQGSRAVVINTAPVIHIHPDITERDTVLGGTFPQLSVSVAGSLPFSYQWYTNTANSNIGGTLIPDATGAIYTPLATNADILYYYVVVSNSCGSVTSNVSGKHTVIVIVNAEGCNNAIPGWGNSLGSISLATDSIWIVGNQAWSDAVTATNCQKETYDGGLTDNFNADCRSNPDYPGDLFSWCAVMRFQNQLCPAPWRIPTSQDFIDLDKALGGDGNQRQNDLVSLAKYVGSDWGGAFGGHTLIGPLITQGQWGRYWSQTRSPDGRFPRYMTFSDNGRIEPAINFPAHSGVSLRCVRDTILSCNNNTPGWGDSLGTVSFASSIIWTIGNQVWSDAVTATACNKTNYDGGSINSSNADCRSNPGFFGDFFSWCAVARFQNELCPDDWRVPLVQDFIDLDFALGGTGNAQENNPLHRDRYLNDWGGVYTGFFNGSVIQNPNTMAYYWSLSVVPVPPSSRHVLFFTRANTRNPDSVWPDWWLVTGGIIGITLRCVRDR